LTESTSAIPPCCAGGVLLEMITDGMFLKRYRQRRLFRRLAVEEAQRVRPAVTAARADLPRLRRAEFWKIVDPLAPQCPVCGNQLTVRTAKRSRTPGTQFWGCRSYPNCTFTAHIDEIDGPAPRSFAL
jgi:hypothetical protein